MSQLFWAFFLRKRVYSLCGRHIMYPPEVFLSSQILFIPVSLQKHFCWEFIPSSGWLPCHPTTLLSILSKGHICGQAIALWPSGRVNCSEVGTYLRVFCGIWPLGLWKGKGAFFSGIRKGQGPGILEKNGATFVCWKQRQGKGKKEESRWKGQQEKPLLVAVCHMGLRLFNV